MTCTSCSREIPEGSRFCPHRGAASEAATGSSACWVEDGAGTILAVLWVLAIASYGFYTSFAGRLLFGEGLLQE